MAGKKNTNSNSNSCKAYDHNSSVASFLVLGGGGGKTPFREMYRKKKVLILRERAPQKHIFSGLKIHLHTYTINAVSFNYLWYGAIKRHYTDKTLKSRKIYEYASERSERA